MPPAALSCPRDQLTSYAGTVIAYIRTDQRVELTIDTDADTVEDVSTPARRDLFLLDGAPLAGGDGERLLSRSDRAIFETRPGQLGDGMRVIAWVCLDESTPPVLDWRPRSH